MEGSLVVVTTSETKLSSNRSSFNPPELSELLPQEKYHVETGLDSWQLGILVCYLLQGKCPWGAADAWEDSKYRSYVGWLKKKSLKVPEPLRNCTPRFIRLFKRLCEPKPYQRWGRKLFKINRHIFILISKFRNFQIWSERTSQVFEGCLASEEKWANRQSKDEWRFDRLDHGGSCTRKRGRRQDYKFPGKVDTVKFITTATTAASAFTRTGR